MAPCDPNADHKRATINGLMVNGASALAIAVFGYIFYNLYDFAVNDVEHFDNWNRTMNELNFVCPQHWALNVRCCTCKTTNYGHCCIRDAWAGYCLVPACEPENSATSRGVSWLFAVLVAVLLVLVCIVFVLSIAYVLLSLFSLCCARHFANFNNRSEPTQRSMRRQPSVKVISTEGRDRSAMYSVQPTDVSVQFTNSSSTFA